MIPTDGQRTSVDGDGLDYIRNIHFSKGGAHMALLTVFFLLVFGFGFFFLLGSADGGLLLFVLFKFKRLASRVITNIKTSTIALVPDDIWLSSRIMDCAFSMVA
jgi:hypothetical protein